MAPVLLRAIVSIEQPSMLLIMVNRRIVPFPSITVRKDNRFSIVAKVGHVPIETEVCDRLIEIIESLPEVKQLSLTPQDMRETVIVVSFAGPVADELKSTVVAKFMTVIDPNKELGIRISYATKSVITKSNDEHYYSII